MSNALHKQTDPVMPPTPSRIGLLQTRCQSSRLIDVPVQEGKVPAKLEIVLIPLKGQEGEERRAFYLAGETEIPGPEPRERALVYREGPSKEPSRIIVPEMPLPQKLIH